MVPGPPPAPPHTLSGVFDMRGHAHTGGRGLAANPAGPPPSPPRPPRSSRRCALLFFGPPQLQEILFPRGFLALPTSPKKRRLFDTIRHSAPQTQKLSIFQHAILSMAWSLHDFSQFVEATAYEARFCRKTYICGICMPQFTSNWPGQRTISGLLVVFYPRYSKNHGHGCGMSAQ